MELQREKDIKPPKCPECNLFHLSSKACLDNFRGGAHSHEEGDRDIKPLLQQCPKCSTLQVSSFMLEKHKLRCHEQHKSFQATESGDQLLVSRKAYRSLALHLSRHKLKEEGLHEYNMDESKSSQYRFCDASLQKAFKEFLEKRGSKHCLDLFDEHLVPDTDPRVKLRGCKMVVAEENMPKGTALGIYTGKILEDKKGDGSSKDFRAECAWLKGKTDNPWLAINTYLFKLPIGPKTELIISAFGRGNKLLRINAPTTL